MKNHPTRTVVLTKPIPCLAIARAMGLDKTVQFMKTRLPILKLLVLYSLFAAASAFGQATLTWTGSPGDGTNLAVAVNWGGTLPSTANSDTAEWTGSVPGPLNLVYNNSAWASGFGQSGVHLHLTSGQTSPINISSTPGSGRGPIAFYNIVIDSGAGAFSFGGPDSANVINWVGRPTGAIHAMVNNSANKAILTPWIQYTAGGGAVWTLDFSGTGNWQCDSFMNNNNGVGMIIQVDGPGTVFWNPTGFLGNAGINSPIVINGGELVLQNPHIRLGNQAITMNGNFTFNMTNAAAEQTLSGVFSGGGTNRVVAGSLTLSGASTYTGDTILQGGTLVVAGAETPGVSGPLGLGMISFNGGALGFSVNNVFDYSSRFNTAAGQAYRFDTAGQSVTFTNTTGLTSSGGTLAKLGAGSLTLAGPSTYSGLTTVSVGKLVFQGAKSGAGNITVADSATLGVYATGTQVAPGTLALGSSGSTTLEFDNVNSTATAPLAPNTLTSAGTVTININSGTLSPGQSYPLLAWTSGSAPAVSLGVLNGFIGNLSTNGNSIRLNITATAYRWTGNNNSSWDLATANNWFQNGGPVVFANGGPALLDDTASGNTSITIAGVLLPTSVTINNVNSNYSIASSSGNNIGGSSSLTKSGGGLLTVSGGANSYTGVTTVSGGTLSVGTLANGGAASDLGAATSASANLVLNGGVLQYTGGGVSIDRSFTVGTGGGTIDASGGGALSLANAGALGYSGNGPRTLTLSGADANNNTLAAPVANNGGATSLAKSGTGKWVLTGANTYSGVTTIAGGLLQIGAGGGSGSLGSGGIVNNSQLIFNRTGNLTVGGVISGTGAVTNEGTGTLILTGNNTFTGGTTINAGTVQLGNGGANGSLETASPIVNNGLLVFNSTSPIIIRGFNAVISGTGNVRVQGTGLAQAVGANTYTGWTQIDTNATFQPFIGNEGQLPSSVMTNNGTLLLIGQEGNPATRGYTNNIYGTGRVLKDNNNQNDGWLVLAGTNFYTGGTLISGGGIQLGDGINPGRGLVIGNVIFTNTPTSFKNPRRLVFGFAEEVVFTNNVISVATDGANGAVDNGTLWQAGPGKVTVTGNNTVPGGTVVALSATLQAGNGGTTGSVGPGGVQNDGTLIINRSANQSLGAMTGAGTFVQLGSGTTTLTASNSASGSTTVSNGTLVVSGRYLGGDLALEGGTTAPAAAGTVATLDVAGNMTINAGTLLISINKGLAQSNSFVRLTNEVLTTSGTVTATGGTLKLLNAGAAVQVGDKFTVFSQPVTGGALMTIVSPGFTVANNLATDGSVTVTAVQPAPTITAAVTGGNQLNLSWPAAWTGGVHLQSQTNTLAVGLSNNWVTIPGTDLSNVYSTPINPTNRAVFYRLINP